MLDAIRSFLIQVINSTYLVIVRFIESVGWLDTPGTYILWIVVGLVLIPFFTKSLYYQYANPHGYYSMSLQRKLAMSAVFVSAWLAFGYANLLRFL
jgi:hypothetical protein